MKRAVRGNFDVNVDAYAGYESRTGRFAALEGWRDETGGDVFDRVGRDSRSPATATDVEAALRGTFRVETGTWSFPSSAADLRAFHRIPALAARLYPTLPPDERVERAGDLLASLDGEFEQVWRWIVGVRE